MSLYHESESEEELADQSGEFGENAKSNIFGRATVFLIKKSLPQTSARM